jgi:hypothetical protein
MDKKLRDELLVSFPWFFVLSSESGPYLEKIGLDWPLIRTSRKVAAKGVTYFHFVE